MTRFLLRPARSARAATLALRLALLLGAIILSTPPSPSPAVAAPPAADGDVRVTLVSDGNEARYRAQEQLFGRPAPSEAVGVTRAVSGEVVLAADGAFVPELSRIVVDLRPLRSDESRRDAYIQANTLQTSQFPYAELVPLQTLGLPLPLPSGPVAFQIVGDLTVHGVTRPTTWDVAATISEQEVAGLASTRVRMTDFGMTPPQVGPVLSIEDEVTLEIQFLGARSLAAAVPAN